ncbi:hypothetical protein PPL_03239 [Heterostelium album PN500]|uniref:CBS domain-containing protein n=1 Tax=Heterostelium pallidum (strain ATCC 26659 / Pp 5 / PN500) TaxID=670386 RepID=D3B4B7_HETP5|nr:hypothetical protein PPL_03239 [Heterostelium album PN500]EFA84165.1 hypothetical protein PPL_03239 [Heterostelium album PN500]|eukprot:XP_020436282.1 hypothetical protein PPL_03239 [Heterostelium album PN500]
MECINFLKTTQIQHAIKPKTIITVDTTTSLEEILRVFDENSIVAAPVYDNETNKVIAVIDMMDIVDFIISFVGLEIVDIQQILKVEPRKFFTILESCGGLFSDSPAINILANRKNKLMVIRESDSFLNAIERMSEKLSKLFIVDSRMTIINLISESDILALIAQNIHVLGDVRTKTINQVGLSSSKIVLYPQETRVINILQDIIQQKITAVPIIDSNKKLFANFSISNLKGLTKKNFSELMLPVVDYLQYQNIKEKKNNLSCLKEKSFHPLTVYSWDTVENAIYKMVSTKVHRLWVVDIDCHPISVVTIDSILKLMSMSRMDINQ